MHDALDMLTNSQADALTCAMPRSAFEQADHGGETSVSGVTAVT
jgi:hypothetical protein